MFAGKTPPWSTSATPARCCGSRAEARATGNFDPEDLDDVLLSMKENLTKLAQLAARDDSKTSEGLSWLRAAVSLPNSTQS